MAAAMSHKSSVDEKSTLSVFTSAIFVSGWTSGSMSKSLCISASPSQSRVVSCSDVNPCAPVDVDWDWEDFSSVGPSGKGADESRGDGARISRRRVSIAFSSTGEEVDVSLKAGVGADVGGGLSSSLS